MWVGSSGGRRSLWGGEGNPGSRKNMPRIMTMWQWNQFRERAIILNPEGQRDGSAGKALVAQAWQVSYYCFLQVQQNRIVVISPMHLWGGAVIVLTNTTQFGSPDCIKTESDRSPTCDPSIPTSGCMGNGGKEPPKAPISLPNLVGNSKVRPSPTREKAIGKARACLSSDLCMCSSVHRHMTVPPYTH